MYPEPRSPKPPAPPAPLRDGSKPMTPTNPSEPSWQVALSRLLVAVTVLVNVAADRIKKEK